MRPHEFPICWPDGWPRAKYQVKSLFRTGFDGAMKNVRDELRLLAKESRIEVRDIVISSNATLGTSEPKDPGVAVWFTWDGEWKCCPVDRYLTPKENLQAIARSIAADREKLRHCGINFIRGSFKAYNAPALPVPSWRRELGFEPGSMPSRTEIEAKYKKLALEHHPDRGGDAERFKAITEAKAAAERELAA